MTTYNVISTKSNVFSLSQNERILGNLTYKGWFSSQATIELSSGLMYDLQPKGFWENIVEVKSGEAVLFDSEMKWTGKILINNNLNDAVSPFTFKHKSVIKNTFVLLHPTGEELILVEPSFKWNRSNYDYQLSTSEAFEHLPNKELLLLLTVHCANYYINTILTTAILSASS